MSDKRDLKTDPGQETVYQIRIKGHLGRQWTGWFGDLTIVLTENGDTLLTGPVVDQAALHGLLRKVRDLGMPLLSVVRVDPGPADASDVKQKNETDPYSLEKEKEMNTNSNTFSMQDMKVRLSTLWLFATLNYLYADVMALMDPEILGGLITGNAKGGIQMTPELLLGAAIFMEIPIAMVVLSRVLQYRANRWANIIAGTIKTAAIALSMFVGTRPALYYAFFGTIEIVCTSLIVWYAYKWPNPEG